tara:strand:+ start:488 stop:727 length:240 start_codon:yes stop_codon:yes gene_type:complete
MDIDKLLTSFNKMSISYVKNEISKEENIDNLTSMLSKVSLSDKIDNNYKNMIFYWVSLQVDSINRRVLDKETLQYGLAF